MEVLGAGHALEIKGESNMVSVLKGLTDGLNTGQFYDCIKGSYVLGSVKWEPGKESGVVGKGRTDPSPHPGSGVIRKGGENFGERAADCARGEYMTWEVTMLEPDMRGVPDVSP